ncbi:MAG: hypothetical protein LQ346_003475 [Caloplaca aetnensis]|nr:MAG: hypothetical protein LQ346_003475 [Caloplaca aetnensis]
MATFSPLSFPYETEDKEFEYQPQILDEPFSDFFDHYLTQISGLENHGYETSDAEFPDIFTDGDTTSSASYATDSTSSAPLQPQYNLPQDRSRQENLSSLSKTAFVPQNYHSRGRREKLLPAISGLELLLDIEGRVNTQSRDPNLPHSAPATLTSLPLRRKPRFNTSKCKESSSRDHRVSKAPVPTVKEQPNMIQSLQNQRIESPQPQEWSCSLQQASLAGPMDPFPLSPAAPDMSQYYGEPLNDVSTPRHLTLREQFFQGEKTGEVADPYPPHAVQPSVDDHPETLDIESQQPEAEEPDAAFEGFHEYIQSLQLEPPTTQHQAHHPSPWEPSVSSSSDMTYTISTEQAASTWNHGLPDDTNNYYSHHHASKSAPSLPFTLNSAISLEYIPGTIDEHQTLENPDPSSGFVVSPGHPFTVPSESHQYAPPPTPSSYARPAPEGIYASPRRTSSPAARIPISNHRRRSKSAQRRKSAGNLKSSRSQASMGFVNYTPNDSKRILTGVAPSGSSKTKARREQEANEKKRKLSLAVLRAVEEAGGDPEPLRRGLLIDE